MNFDLDQLRAFEAVMRLRSFRGAADAIGRPQSSISQQIGRLEGQIGRALFVRTTRRVDPTPDGRALLAYARSVLAIAAEARRHFEQPAQDGVLRLGIVEDFALGELHLVLGLFRRQYPRFGLSLRTGLSARLFRDLDAGALDIVLGKRLPGRSQGHLLYRRPLIWCGRADALAEAADAPVPVVTYTEPSSMRALIVRALERSGRSFRIVAESEGLTGIRAAVTAGFGITAFSEGFVPADVPHLARDVGLPTLEPVEYVIDQRAYPRADAVDAFIALLSASAAALSADLSSDPRAAADRAPG
ncbi:LysR substrate-binding domain-containing protein [Methylobacterium sp. NEAU 140]|uniref:LysR substrate-binding domain-containing protein n=1 Tax=Methylobacterium sp. NEAU 140 TaxID=3064945 RepID=UPI002734C137|nr:LysR substrate-binding domain-containing protein [Methylobacterium sp. NEAU 140]MDP4024623.1 LysR substrate-binding domain-containing protein [Methylobacterium sp. NEAU 140]